MKLTILAVGSRGDVQPFVALGHRLAQRGHQVRVAAAIDYRGLVEAHGLAFAPIIGSIQDYVNPQIATSFQGRLGNPIRMLRHFFTTIEPLLERILSDCWEASRDADALVVSTLGRYCGDPIAERLAIPMHVCHFHPNGPTQTHPHMLLPVLPLNLPGAKRYHRFSYTLVEWVFWLCFQRPLNRIRQQLGLPAERAHISLRRHQHEHSRTLHAYSSHIAPPPADWNGLETSITGYWLLPKRAWEPPIELLRFLDSGEPPVLFTFGSMMLGNAGPKMAQWITDSINELGIRGLIFRGWGELEVHTASSLILMIEASNHQWLLPRLSAVIHHGGAGITAATLYAKTRALIVPFLGDQYFWGQRLNALGAAPKPMPIKQLSQQKFLGGLEHLLKTQRYQERTNTLGSLLTAEDGVGNAVKHIETGGQSCCQSASLA